ncbi:MAG: class I SAM-dependent methyltransferase [Desulfomonile sp.]|nr:class I SAM-dependent methyltransferase [Desulfomonile sp.]
METVTCNLCGSDRHTVVYSMPDRLFNPEEFFTVVECKECGLGFVNPRPTPKEIGKYYPAAYYNYFRENVEFHRKRYRREAAYLEAVPATQRYLLDVGCANGDFPRFMKSLGWTVEGLEVSPAAAPISDFPVYRVPFPEANLGGSRYGAVTMWAVLEHVHDPMSYIAKARSVLQPGGYFVFLVTNFDSLYSRKLYQEDIPRHLYFFTEPTVRQYLNLNGFNLVSCRFDDDVYGAAPLNWLFYFVVTYVKRRPFEWADRKPTCSEYLAARGLEPALISKLRYVLDHPFAGLDAMLSPAVALVEKLLKRYGIVTYVARKQD